MPKTDLLELKVPPVGVLLLVGAAMWGVARLVPTLSFPFRGRTVVAGVLAAAGMLVALAGIAAFVGARTTVDPMRPSKSSALVRSGVYRVTRNPMYVGLLLLLSAWGAYLSNLPAMAGLPAFVAYLTRFQILPEERVLREKFGAAFEEYRRSVRRWL
jgi:protein-S-isoprenylcysteine O-methyltransferase Ste14